MLGLMRRASLLAVLAAACVVTPAPDLAIDTGRSCSGIVLEVRDPKVLPGWDVHALAVERSDGDSAWALASDGKGRLQLTGWPAGPALDLSALGSPADFKLVTGAIEGQTWLLLDQPEAMQVWRLDDAASGGLFAGPPIAGFPAAGAWTRRLVFLDQVPYLIAVPASGDASTVELQLARLDEDTLTPEPAVALPLWRTCPEQPGAEDSLCPQGLVTGPATLELLSTTEAGSLGGAAVMVGMYTSIMADPPAMTATYTTLVVTVELRSLGPDQPPAMIRRELPIWTTAGPVVITSSFIAADSNSLYWLSGVESLFDDGGLLVNKDFLYRASRDNLDVNETRPLETADKAYRSHLLQIGGRAAFGQIQGQRWTITPVYPAGLDVRIKASYTLDADARVSLAGRGEFLVHGPSGASRVAAACQRAPESE